MHMAFDYIRDQLHNLVISDSFSSYTFFKLRFTLQSWSSDDRSKFFRELAFFSSMEYSCSSF